MSEPLSPAKLAEVNGAIVFLREQGANIAADAVETLLQHCGKPALRPNVMRCGRCKLRVTGIVATASCPNGCGPLWPATWEEECLTAERDRDEFLQIAQRIAIEKAELRREADRLRKCANCQGSRIAPIGDGYSVNPCPACASAEFLGKCEQFAEFLIPEPAGTVVVTTNEAGECTSVTRQDDEHRILSVIWERRQFDPVTEVSA